MSEKIAVRYRKKPRDDFSHNVYSDDKKETLKTIRPLVDLQSDALKVKESNASHVAFVALKRYSIAKNFKQIALMNKDE